MFVRKIERGGESFSEDSPAAGAVGAGGGGKGGRMLGTDALGRISDGPGWDMPVMCPANEPARARRSSTEGNAGMGADGGGGGGPWATVERRRWAEATGVCPAQPGPIGRSGSSSSSGSSQSAIMGPAAATGGSGGGRE
jgi:hypothetical protein